MSERRIEGPPEVGPEPGWVVVEPPRLEGGRGSFVSGDAAEGRLRVRYFRHERGFEAEKGGDRRLIGRSWFGPGAQGPPDHAHGGSIAAVLDEAMGAAAWSSGYVVVAVRLVTDFRRMIPLGTDAFLEAWVDRVEGRKVWTTGRLLDAAGKPFAEAEGLFLKLDPESHRPLIEKAAASLGVDVSELLAKA